MEEIIEKLIKTVDDNADDMGKIDAEFVISLLENLKNK